jgi:hypothetical protein
MARCPSCKQTEVVRKPGRGATPACAECRKKRNDPKHYDASGVRYGTPGRITLRSCYYCRAKYERRRPNEPKRAVCFKTKCLTANKERLIVERRERKQAAPSAESVYRKQQRILRKLERAGLSAEWLEQQGGYCGICKTRDPGGKGSWHIDHDHRCCSYPESGAVVGCAKCIRGILCYHCNTGLGHFRDDPIRLRAAIAWLTSAADREAEVARRPSL